MAGMDDSRVADVETKFLYFLWSGEYCYVFIIPVWPFLKELEAAVYHPYS